MREMTNLQIGELHSALMLLTRDHRRGAQPVQIQGDLTYPPLALRVARAIRELAPAVDAMDASQTALLQKYVEENELPAGVDIPNEIVRTITAPVLREKQEVPDIKPITGAILKKAGVTLDAGMIIALDFMLVDYEEGEEEIQFEEVKK